MSIYENAFKGFTVHIPSPEGWKKIHERGYEVQQNGPMALWFNWMRDLLREEVPATCKHAVLAMTEFSPIVRRLKLAVFKVRSSSTHSTSMQKRSHFEYLGLTTGSMNPEQTTHD